MMDHNEGGASLESLIDELLPAIIEASRRRGDESFRLLEMREGDFLEHPGLPGGRFKTSATAVRTLERRGRVRLRPGSSPNISWVDFIPPSEEDQNQSRAVFNFYSPVGAVQTGPNASATVFQNVTPQDREMLLSALNLVKQGLAGVNTLPAHPKEEIVELVEEAESETKKPKPNNSKLVSTFMIIAQAIQAVGSLKPAYDALKTALIPFGVQLP